MNFSDYDWRDRSIAAQEVSMKKVNIAVLAIIGAIGLAASTSVAVNAAGGTIVISGPSAVHIREGDQLSCYPTGNGWLKCWKGGISSRVKVGGKEKVGTSGGTLAHDRNEDINPNHPPGEPLAVVPAGSLRTDKDGDVDLICKNHGGTAYCRRADVDHDGD
jgi:hypothetical protein